MKEKSYSATVDIIVSAKDDAEAKKMILEGISGLGWKAHVVAIYDDSEEDPADIADKEGRN